jgi:hypothetical protein
MDVANIVRKEGINFVFYRISCCFVDECCVAEKKTIFEISKHYHETYNMLSKITYCVY